MRCIDDESWEVLKRHTAAHLRSRIWLGGAFSVISPTPHTTRVDDYLSWDALGARTIIVRAPRSR
jgi:hypothetical protein